MASDAIEEFDTIFVNVREVFEKRLNSKKKINSRRHFGITTLECRFVFFFLRKNECLLEILVRFMK